MCVHQSIYLITYTCNHVRTHATMYVHMQPCTCKLPEAIVDIMEDEEEEEAEAAVALAKATLWKSSNRLHVWCSTLLAAAVMTSILLSIQQKIE